LEQVEKFKDSVSITDQTADYSCGIRASLRAARSSLRSLSHLWKDRALNRTIKMKLLVKLVWLVALYGCETLTVKAADVKRPLVFEKLCHRRPLWISWTACRTIEAEAAALQPYHQSRDLCTHILEGRNDGQRIRGQQRRRWRDDIRD